MRTVWLTSWQGSRRFDADACCKRDHTVLKLSHYIFLTDARTYCHPLFWYQSCACLGSALCDDFTRNLTSWGTPTTLMQWTPVSCVANRYLVVILQGLLKLLSLFLFWSTTFYREGFPEKSAVFFSFTGVCLSTEGGGLCPGRGSLSGRVSIQWVCVRETTRMVKSTLYVCYWNAFLFNFISFKACSHRALGVNEP